MATIGTVEPAGSRSSEQKIQIRHERPRHIAGAWTGAGSASGRSQDVAERDGRHGRETYFSHGRCFPHAAKGSRQVDALRRTISATSLPP